MENKEILIGKSFNTEHMIEYADASVVSKTILKKESGTVTLFAFDRNEGLSEHTAPYDAMIQLIDGKANIIIAGKDNILEKGDTIIMPASVPHAVKAVDKFKMLLTMIKSH